MIFRVTATNTHLPVTESVRILDSLATVDPAPLGRARRRQSHPRPRLPRQPARDGLRAEATGWAPRYLTLWDGERLAERCRST
jgi:hypothetical protein